MNYKNFFLLIAISVSQAGCFVGAALGGSFMVQSTVATGASYAVSGKGLSDHAMSEVADKDCKLFNMIDGKSVCQNYKQIPINDKSSRPEVREKVATQ